MVRRIKTTQVGAVRTEFADKQGGRCAICLQPTPPASQVLDHDHTTGYLRAMLCRNCNGIEGKIKKPCPTWTAYVRSQLVPQTPCCVLGTT